MHIIYNPHISLGADEWISLSKPKKVVNLTYHPGIDTLEPSTPIKRIELLTAHSAGYVDGVLEGTRANGFGNTRGDVLKQILAANGVMRTATELAMETRVAFAPVSGFHHAGYNDGDGYCTFNGLIIALQALKAAGKINTALILDFDGHYGDGTDNIINRLQLDWIANLTRHAPFTNPRAAIGQALSAIDTHPDIVIYQAGADSHVDDTYGAGYFDDRGWELRDALIFQACNELRIPIVWNLAGGYSGALTLALHASTYWAAVREFEPDRRNASPSLSALKDQAKDYLETERQEQASA